MLQIPIIFFFAETITKNDGCVQIKVPPDAYEIESLNNEKKRIIIDEGHFTETNYPFTIKSEFSTLDSVVEVSRQGPLISFLPDGSIRNPLGFNSTTIDEDYNPSPNPVDVLSIDNIFLECHIAPGMNFKGKRSRKIHNFTLDIDPGSMYIEEIRGGVQWYMMCTKYCVSSNSFKLKNENGNVVSFNARSITFGLSIQEV